MSASFTSPVGRTWELPSSPTRSWPSTGRCTASTRRDADLLSSTAGESGGLKGPVFQYRAGRDCMCLCHMLFLFTDSGVRCFAIGAFNTLYCNNNLNVVCVTLSPNKVQLTLADKEITLNVLAGAEKFDNLSATGLRSQMAL